MEKRKVVDKGFGKWGLALLLIGLFLWPLYLVSNIEPGLEDSDRKYDIRCVDANGLYYAFVKTKDDWWRTVDGRLVVKDGGRTYTFNKRSCSYEAFDE